MACYRPTRNCYSFSFLWNFAALKLRYTNWITRLHITHTHICSLRSVILPRNMNPLLLYTFTCHCSWLLTPPQHRSIWEVNNFQKLLFIVSSFNSSSSSKEWHWTFPNVYFFVLFLLGLDFCAVFFCTDFDGAKHTDEWPIPFIHKCVHIIYCFQHVACLAVFYVSVKCAHRISHSLCLCVRVFCGNDNVIMHNRYSPNSELLGHSIVSIRSEEPSLWFVLAPIDSSIWCLVKQFALQPIRTQWMPTNLLQLDQWTLFQKYSWHHTDLQMGINKCTTYTIVQCTMRYTERECVRVCART